jgi:hypothetical protein
MRPKESCWTRTYLYELRDDQYRPTIASIIYIVQYWSNWNFKHDNYTFMDKALTENQFPSNLVFFWRICICDLSNSIQFFIFIPRISIFFTFRGYGIYETLHNVCSTFNFRGYGNNKMLYLLYIPYRMSIKRFQITDASQTTN